MTQKTKKGRASGTFENRSYYRRYRSNMHVLLDDPAVQYKISRVLSSPSSLYNIQNATNKGCMPVKKTFNNIAKALYTIDKWKSGMDFQDYCLWLADRVEENT